MAKKANIQTYTEEFKLNAVRSQPAWITHASNPSFRISRPRSCTLTIYNYNYRGFQAKLKQRAPIEYRCALAA